MIDRSSSSSRFVMQSNGGGATAAATRLSMTKIDLLEATVEQLHQCLDRGDITAVQLCKAYLARIEETRHLNAVIDVPTEAALKEAEESDARRKAGKSLGILDGIPVLVKDNIALRPTKGVQTTAGSLALEGGITSADATIVAKLRSAGAIMLATANLTEWANGRGEKMPNGWSARGGQCTSPYHERGDVCGSSSGSGVGMAIGLAALALGSETCGSICMPAGRCNVVGIKPTVGLTSRYGCIPILASCDSPGPMTRTVRDSAILLQAIVGKDDDDKHSLDQPDTPPDYLKALTADGLSGARIGVLRSVYTDASADNDFPQSMIDMYNEQIASVFPKLGATLVDPAELICSESKKDLEVLEDALFALSPAEMCNGINSFIDFLATRPPGINTLRDIVSFNSSHASEELPACRASQAHFIKAVENAQEMDDPAYLTQLASNYEIARLKGIDATLKKYNLDALIAPSDSCIRVLPGLAGYPLISIPCGFMSEDTRPLEQTDEEREHGLPIYPGPGVPFGITFVGTAYSEAKLLKYGYAYEQATQIRTKQAPMRSATPKTQLADVNV
ncbi:uncharacterized protein L969DRAFT_45691 [Mixia osmundae IAM 14324]|uniref:Amidase domain-containing protein n=1 Tax=Mixia osmundae (strain CBS 9802 / IAM 14324 / JCM 22182 / KY 12970) TaxID=764103 RepID=G7DXS1_MIXOS|nr:uncharacterized protein L969DRAFT_45691 [Mixia osmundae IAM 14324]KEI41132.1 hypothetical protein L969DRAFT_45691 [Mixia osmundae IAM 14324]GAA95381.1 hypothetical protein E5Q_02035 [Mixia osmundae IAM 14324]